jgi:hypothetical protein
MNRPQAGHQFAPCSAASKLPGAPGWEPKPLAVRRTVPRRPPKYRPHRRYDLPHRHRTSSQARASLARPLHRHRDLARNPAAHSRKRRRLLASARPASCRPARARQRMTVAPTTPPDLKIGALPQPTQPATRRRASDLLATFIDALVLAGDTLLSQRPDRIHLDREWRGGHASTQAADEAPPRRAVGAVIRTEHEPRTPRKSLRTDRPAHESQVTDEPHADVPVSDRCEPTVSLPFTVSRSLLRLRAKPRTSLNARPPQRKKKGGVAKTTSPGIGCRERPA